MAAEERNIIVNLIGEILVNLYFAYLVWQMFGAGLATAPDGVQVWARTVIWIIPVGIGAGIVLSILARAFADQDGAVQLDERDRGIQIKGMAVTMVVAALAFIATLSVLALGAPALTGLNILFFGFGAAAMMGDLAKLVMYQVFGSDDAKITD